MSVTTFSMAFLMGFTLSLHCAGMCGPIMMVLPFQMYNGIKRTLAILLYHTGRISVYASLAILLHSFRNLFDPKIQQYVSVGLGGLLLIFGMVSFFPIQNLQLKMPWSAIVKKELANFIGNPGLMEITMAGILNGLLPCGLVYVALSASITATTASQAALFMYVFGLGTMPILLAITLLSKSSFLRNKLTFLRFNSIKKLVPALMFVFGCIFILRGLNLGIPYLSPKVEITAHSINSSCCHKMKE
jgi:sulfite exporter TauE/SafE